MYLMYGWTQKEQGMTGHFFFTCTICNSISFFLVKIILLTLYHKLKTSRDIIFMQQNEKKMPERHLLWDTYTYTKYFGLIIDRTCNVIKMSLQWSMAEALNAYHYLIKMAKTFSFLPLAQQKPSLGTLVVGT